MTSEIDILDALRAGEVRLPPLGLELVGVEPGLDSEPGSDRPDAYVDVSWADRVFRFAALIKAQATPKTFRQALDQLRRYADAGGMKPLLIAPYLASDRLAELEASAVSGIDLSGNGVVVVPGDLLVLRSGSPNQFPSGRGIRNVYHGTSSLVARAFLLRPSYDSVQEVMDEVTERGGRVSLSTVSKVLKVLEEDLVIQREGRSSRLLQADELLDRLAGNLELVRVKARNQYRWAGSYDELLGRLGSSNFQLVLTGAASAEVYAVMPREKTIRCYCPAIGPMEKWLGGELAESSRFPDLELVETRDPTVYFDARSTQGVGVASPLQCWLELHSGDKRQQDASRMVRQRIEDELHRQGWKAP